MKSGSLRSPSCSRAQEHPELYLPFELSTAGTPGSHFPWVLQSASETHWGEFLPPHKHCSNAEPEVPRVSSVPAVNLGSETLPGTWEMRRVCVGSQLGGTKAAHLLPSIPAPRPFRIDQIFQLNILLMEGEGAFILLCV